MNKEQALHAFWASFGIPAYDENTVPTDATLPRLTYSVATDSFGSSVPLSASLWYRTTSWEDITLKSNEIEADIGRGGKLVAYEGGAIWIKRGVPFAQRVSDENDAIRRIYLNVEAEYISAD